MPRLPRKCPPGLPVHVIQRGNNRQICFGSDADRKAYANWLCEAAVKFDVSIHAWVFMSNHVHLLMTPTSWSGISRAMQYLGRLYVRHFNFTHERTGTLYEGRFRSSIVENRRYLLACYRYIELNPVRAGIVADPADYTWSSYRANALGIKARLWTPHAEYLSLGATWAARRDAYRGLFGRELGVDTIGKIRNAANSGFALGTDAFRREMEVLTGRRHHHLQRGPRPKAPENGAKQEGCYSDPKLSSAEDEFLL